MPRSRLRCQNRPIGTTRVFASYSPDAAYPGEPCRRRAQPGRRGRPRRWFTGSVLRAGREADQPPSLIVAILRIAIARNDRGAKLGRIIPIFHPAAANTLHMIGVIGADWCRDALSSQHLAVLFPSPGIAPAVLALELDPADFRSNRHRPDRPVSLQFARPALSSAILPGNRRRPASVDDLPLATTRFCDAGDSVSVDCGDDRCPLGTSIGGNPSVANTSQLFFSWLKCRNVRAALWRAGPQNYGKPRGQTLLRNESIVISPK